MFEFLEVAMGVQALYEHAQDEILETDFFELTPSQYEKLPPEERDQKWFMINPEKLKSSPVENEIFVVSESEKSTLLRAVKLINRPVTTGALSADSSFLERLFYNRALLPTCLYDNSDDSTKQKGKGKVIPLYGDKEPT